MKIELLRTYKAATTEGELLINSKLICTTLEDIGRPHGIKIPGHTCIPEGTYYVSANKSLKFNRRMPIIFTNKKTMACEHAGIRFTGIRIHAGSTTGHTEGCILVDAEYLPAIEAAIIDAIDRKEEVTLMIGRKL